MPLINHIHIKVTDARAAVDWFVAAFGFAELSQEIRPAGDRMIRCQPAEGEVRITFSDLPPGTTLPGPIPGPHLGIEHIAFNTPDLDAELTRLTALGATVAVPPSVTPGGLRIAFVLTPQDLRLELMQTP